MAFPPRPRGHAGREAGKQSETIRAHHTSSELNCTSNVTSCVLCTVDMNVTWFKGYVFSVVVFNSLWGDVFLLILHLMLLLDSLSQTAVG